MGKQRGRKLLHIGIFFHYFCTLSIWTNVCHFHSFFSRTEWRVDLSNEWRLDSLVFCLVW